MLRYISLKYASIAQKIHEPTANVAIHVHIQKLEHSNIYDLSNDATVYG
jgi:hypothetical protein